LTANSHQGHLGSYLANGFLGLRMGPLGVGKGADATRFACVAGVYHNEKLARIPDWNRIDVFNGSHWFSEGSSTPSTPGTLRESERPVRPDIRDYSQTLDLRRGLLLTRFIWDADRRPIQIKSEMFLSRTRPGIAVTRFTFQADRPIQVRFALNTSEASGKVLASGPASTPLPQLLVRVTNGSQPMLISEKMGLFFSPGSDVRFATGNQPRPKSKESPSQTFEVQCSKGQPVTVERIVSIAVSLKNPSHQAQIALENAFKQGFDKLLEEHTAAWEKIWQSDIAIDGDEEAQRVARTALFYLYSSARPGLRWSLPPMGLSSDTYGGHIFWDAEVWMYPVLLLLQPDMAREMLEYRLDRLPAARQNARDKGFPGADFPWESAATGQEAAPPEFAQERHITADVAWALWQYYLATSNREWLARRAWPALRDTADFWAARATWNQSKKRYEIKGVLTPDETAGVVDNSAWTNAMAQTNLLIASQAARLLNQPAPAKWKEVAEKLWIPFDPRTNRFLEHDRYQGQTTKQADTELLIFPGRLPMSSKARQATFDYYVSKTSKFGPAMTSSIHAIIAAQLGRPEDALRYFRESYQPFLRPAFDLFSEKRTTDSVYFLTGASGMLQSLLYGFGGIQTKGEKIQVRSVLPSSWKKLAVQGIHWRGKRYRLKAEAGTSGMLTAYEP